MSNEDLIIGNGRPRHPQASPIKFMQAEGMSLRTLEMVQMNVSWKGKSPDRIDLNPEAFIHFRRWAIKYLLPEDFKSEEGFKKWRLNGARVWKDGNLPRPLMHFYSSDCDDLASHGYLLVLEYI